MVWKKVIQFSRVNYNVAIVQGIQEGFSGGLILQYLSQRQLGIQLEVNYRQRGLLASTSAYRVSRQQDYLEIPFMTHFALGKKSFRVVLNLGSYLSFLLFNLFNIVFYFFLILFLII